MWPVYQLSILCLTDSYSHSPRNFFHIDNHRHWCQIFQSKPFYNWQNGIKWRCYVFCSAHSSLSTTGCNLVRFDHSHIGRPYQTWNFSQLFLLLEFTHFLFFSAPFTEYPCSSFRVIFCSLGEKFWDSEIFKSEFSLSYIYTVAAQIIGCVYVWGGGGGVFGCVLSIHISILAFQPRHWHHLMGGKSVYYLLLSCILFSIHHDLFYQCIWNYAVLKSNKCVLSNLLMHNHIYTLSKTPTL